MHFGFPRHYLPNYVTPWLPYACRVINWITEFVLVEYIRLNVKVPVLRNVVAKLRNSETLPDMRFSDNLKHSYKVPLSHQRIR